MNLAFETRYSVGDEVFYINWWIVESVKIVWLNSFSYFKNSRGGIFYETSDWKSIPEEAIYNSIKDAYTKILLEECLHFNHKEKYIVDKIKEYKNELNETRKFHKQKALKLNKQIKELN